MFRQNELKDIQNKLLEFSDMVMNYSFNDYAGQAIPKTKEGLIMNTDYWQNVQNDLERRVTLHQIEKKKSFSSRRNRLS